MTLPKPLTVLVLCLLSSTCWANQPQPAPANYIPPEAAVVLEITNPQPVLDLFLSPQRVRRISDSEFYQDLRKNTEFSGLLTLTSLLEARFGKTWREMLFLLAGGGVTLASGPEERSAFIADSQDAGLLNNLHETLLTFARQGPRKLEALEHRGVTGWLSQEGKVYTVLGNRLLWANDEAGFRAIINQYSEPAQTSLADVPEYLDALEAVGGLQDGSIFLNLKLARTSQDSEDSLLESSNPLDVLLSAGVKDYVRNVDWAVLGLRAEQNALLLRGLTDSNLDTDSSLSAFARPSQGIPQGFKVKRQILGASFYRDLQSFYAAKDELFPERTSGLIFFENMMGIFFSGRDFTDEILAELKPTFQMVAARQEYEVKPPKIQLPGFALIFEMVTPDSFSSVMEEAWQKALGLLNFTRGQQAQPGLIIDRADYLGVKYSYAYFAEPAAEDSGSDFRFNFRPALAMPGHYLILSSTDQLARDLIEAIIHPQSDMASLEGVHTYITTDFTQLTQTLDLNRESLVQQNMLKEGNTREKAESDIAVFLLLLNQIAETNLKVGWDNNSPWSDLEIRFEPDVSATSSEWSSDSQ